MSLRDVLVPWGGIRDANLGFKKTQPLAVFFSNPNSAARLGIEPRYTASKAVVLPLDDLAIDKMHHQVRHYHNILFEEEKEEPPLMVSGGLYPKSFGRRLRAK